MDKDKQNPDKLLSINEVARLFDVHVETLRRWDNEGKLKAVRIGKLGHRKYKRSDIDKLLNTG